MKPKNLLLWLITFIFMGFTVFPVMALEKAGARGSGDYKIISGVLGIARRQGDHQRETTSAARSTLRWCHQARRA